MSKDPKSNYYDAGGIDVLDVLKAKLTPEQLKGYFLGNTIKYSLRLNHKGTPQRDSEKLSFYSQFLNEEMKNPEHEPKDYEVSYFD